MHLSLPNILTITRILIIPFILLGLYINSDWSRVMSLFLYTYACITDFFDGYLARKQQEISKLGQFLDPIADKLLVVTVIIGLLNLGASNEGLGMWNGLAGLVIILREILVSGLREFLAEIQVKVPVTYLAKWKTSAQMICLGFLIAGDAGAKYLNLGFLPSYNIGIVLLWVSALLTIITGYSYFRSSLPYMLK